MRSERADPAAPAAPPAPTGPLTVAVVGPTATGKSELALNLAEALDGEIVGADAMQLYRGMDIGTAKVPPDARRGIPHHQIDVLDVIEEASVAAYQRHSRADLSQIAARGGRPILAGGTGLYVRAALDELDIPPTDPVVRARLEDDLAEHGVDALRERLARADPEAAARIEPRNARRIVRALEVIELTGRPFSASMPTRTFVVPALLVGLDLPRPVLDDRIAARVRQMWAMGLVDEASLLDVRGLRAGRTASKAIGYAQALAQLDGVLDEASAIEETIGATRRYARRQQAWFRADPRVRWFDAGSPTLTAEVLAHLRERGQ